MKHIISILLLLVIFFVHTEVEAKYVNEDYLNRLKTAFESNPEAQAEYEKFHALEPKREMFVPVFRYHTRMVKMKIAEKGKPTRYEMVEEKYYTLEDQQYNMHLEYKAERKFMEYYELWKKFFSTEKEYYTASRRNVARAVALLKVFEDGGKIFIE